MLEAIIMKAFEWAVGIIQSGPSVMLTSIAVMLSCAMYFVDAFRNGNVKAVVWDNKWKTLGVAIMLVFGFTLIPWAMTLSIPGGGFIAIAVFFAAWASSGGLLLRDKVGPWIKKGMAYLGIGGDKLKDKLTDLGKSTDEEGEPIEDGETQPALSRTALAQRGLERAMQ